MSAQRLQRLAGIGSIPPSWPAAYPHTPGGHVYGNSAVPAEERKTLGWLRANALDRRLYADTVATYQPSYLPSACIPAQSHYTACKKYTPRRQHNRHLELTL